MANRIAEIRHNVYQAIKNAKDSNSLAIKSFEITETETPTIKTLEEITEQPRVVVVGKAYDEVRIKRKGIKEITVPVDIAFQSGLELDNLEQDDNFLTFVDQLRDIVSETPASPYTWINTDSLKDQNDMPFDFKAIRSDATFECYFTAYFKRIVVID